MCRGNDLCTIWVYSMQSGEWKLLDKQMPFADAVSYVEDQLKSVLGKQSVNAKFAMLDPDFLLLACSANRPPLDKLIPLTNFS